MRRSCGYTLRSRSSSGVGADNTRAVSAWAVAVGRRSYSVGRQQGGGGETLWRINRLTFSDGTPESPGPETRRSTTFLMLLLPDRKALLGKKEQKFGQRGNLSAGCPGRQRRGRDCSR